MDDQFTRLWNDLAGRVGGPLTFRLILQPTIAAALAIRAGLQDARAGRPPYFWTLFTSPEQRSALLHDGWHAVAKVFALALVLDVVYQIIVFRFVYPGEALIVAFLLACVPYLMLRGTTNRIARLWRRKPRDAA